MKTINFASFKINQMNKNKFLISSILLFFNALIMNSQSLQDGIKQLENENYSAALNTFTQLNVSNPKNPIFAYYIGEVHYALENFDAAKTAYQIGLNASSKCDECRIGLGKLELSNGRIAEAKKLFESALKGNSKNHQIIALVGDAYLYNKKPLPDEALEYLTRARDLDPKVARYWIHLGDAQLAKSDLGSAMTSYETAVEKDKSDPETYVKMARIWSASKKYDLGIEKLEAAIVLNPEYAIAYKELYEQYIKNKNYNKVLPILEKYVALSGDDVGAKVRLVKFLCFQAKDYERAILEGNKIIATNPEQYSVYRWLAWSYSETDKAEESFKASEKLFAAVEEDTSRKTFPSDYEYFAKASAKLKKMQIAEKNYLKVLELDSSRSNEIYGLLAKAYYDQKMYDKSAEWYAKKESIQALNNTDQYYLGLALFNQGYYSKADSSFAKVLTVTPNYANGWLMRAKCNIELDSNQINSLAKPFYEKYIEFAVVDKEKASVKKNLINAYNYLGYSSVREENYAMAKTYFELTTSLDPADERATEALKILNKK